MSEQQRVFVTVLLCMGIFLGYQYWTVSHMPPEAEPTISKPQVSAGPLQGAPGAPAVPPSLVPQAAPVLVKAESRSFSTELLRGTLSNEGALLTQLDLLQYKGHKTNDEPAPQVSLVAGSSREEGQARIDWQVGGMAAQGWQFVESTAPGALTLAGEAGRKMALQVRLQPRVDAYALDYVLTAINQSDTAQSMRAAVLLRLPGKNKEEGHSFLPGSGGPGAQVGALCEVNGALRRKEFGSVDSEPWSERGRPQFVGLDRQYFVVAAVPDHDVETAASDAEGLCMASAGAHDMLNMTLQFPEVTVAPGGTWEKRFSLYVGPKLDDKLAAVSPALKEVIDYDLWHIPLGFLARPMMVLLKVFHTWTNSWGVAIMALTLVVKVVLLPVTYKQVVSGRRMQLLKPQLDQIKTRFANDKERQQIEQMKLFREKGVNPLGGCLTALLQMPVGIALYRTLWSAVDLYHQPFLWLPDLTAKEPFPFLAIALGGLTLLNQRLTPMAMDNEQAKVMMYVMPVMFTFFMIALPSGLVVYILFNTILTIIQQLAINKRAVAV